MTDTLDETRFRGIFSQLGAVTAYAARRGSRDAEGVAAEVMMIAWRRLAVVPTDDPLPWLLTTARNLVYAEARSRRRRQPERRAESTPEPEVRTLDPGVDAALRSLGHFDREALLLIAWDDLSPAQAAKALGITPAAFRVRLFRARRRLRAALPEAQPLPLAHLDVEGT